MQKNINSFLQLGYFLDYENPRLSFDFSGVDKEKYAQATEQELIELGSKVWLEAIKANFSSNDKHLVPISGGLDSRAILAGLLRFTDAKNIHTYTFGTPKTLDYEVGNYVAKKLGTNHTSFDLTQYQYTQEELEDISVRIDRQTILFHHPPIWEIERKYKGFKLWSGFGGDALSGVKYKADESNNYLEAQKYFFKKNSYVKSIELSKIDLGSEFLSKNHGENFGVSFDELVIFENIVRKFEEPHVLFKGFDYNLPVLYQPWIDFILSVPNKFRENQYLYKEILLHSFPKEFSWKTKTNLGLPLKSTKLRKFFKKIQLKYGIGIQKGGGRNYLDFNYYIRNKSDLQEIIVNNIKDLNSRGVVNYLAPLELLKKHLSGEENYAEELIVLASLEIHLKTGLKL